MELREATAKDGAPIRAVVRESMRASYSLDPDTIDSAVDEWFDDGMIERKVGEDNRTLLLATEDDDVVGMAEFVTIPETRIGDLLWIHVHPEHRGAGVGSTLFEEAQVALEGAGVETIRGIVLADNDDGTAFYEAQGFEQVNERTVSIGGTAYSELVYLEDGAAEMEQDQHGSQEVYIDRTDPDPGTHAPFYPSYLDTDREERYGFKCGNCGSLDTVIDAMSLINCSDCDNQRRKRRWNVAHL